MSYPTGKSSAYQPLDRGHIMNGIFLSEDMHSMKKMPSGEKLILAYLHWQRSLYIFCIKNHFINIRYLP